METTNAQQYPLAFDGNGNPLDVPPEAVAWRVRRGGGRPGRPRVVFDADTGRQLEIPLTGTIEDLVEVGCLPGRYRLEAVDGSGRVIPNVVAITEIVADEPEQPPAAQATPADTLARVVALAEKQTSALCDALGHLAPAFGTLRPAQMPVVVTQHDGGGASMQPQQIAETIQGIAVAAKTIYDAWKAGGGGTGGTGGGGLPS